MTQSEAIDILLFVASNSNEISEALSFSVLNDKYNIVTTRLVNSNIDFENIGENIISMPNEFFLNHNIDVYCNNDAFYRRYEDTKNIIVILGNKNIDSVISISSDKFTDFQYVKNGKSDKITTNYFYLKKLIDLLSHPDVTDYKDTAHNSYFFLSPECGKFEIIEGDYTNLVEISSISIKLFDTYLKLKSMFNNPKGWQYILKNKIIRGLENIHVSDNRFKELILNLTKFIDATEKDFELFLTSRNHETIVQQFENEKYLFADKIRSILQKISASILSIPLSFFAAAFAMENASQLWQQNIIIVSILIYILYAGIVNILYWKDLDVLKDEIYYKVANISMDLLMLKKSLTSIVKPLLSRIVVLRIIVIFSTVLFGIIFIYFLLQFISSEPSHA